VPSLLLPAGVAVVAAALALPASRVLAEPSATPSAGRIVLTGEVQRGISFEKPLPGGLALRLQPDTAGGWLIWIGDPAHPNEDYGRVVTPPYRGVNDRDIQGWHFRNTDNTGPNDGSVNAPQRVRQFEFVADRASFEAAGRALDCMLWPCADMSRERAEAVRAGVERGRGKLTITDLKLGNLLIGKHASVERMKFQVELWLPKAAAR